LPAPAELLVHKSFYKAKPLTANRHQTYPQVRQCFRCNVLPPQYPSISTRFLMIIQSHGTSSSC